MYFKQIKEIVNKALGIEPGKNETRRVCKPGEEAFYDSHVRIESVCTRYLQKPKTQDTSIEAYRLKWMVSDDKDYAVSPGRGKPGVWWNPETGEWAIPYTTKRYKFDGPQKLKREMVALGWVSLRIKFTDIGREPLQAITEADAIAEGYPYTAAHLRDTVLPPVIWYRELWESINGAGSWDKTGDVWVLSFEVVR